MPFFVPSPEKFILHPSERQLGNKKIFQQVFRFISTFWRSSDLPEGKPPSVEEAVM